MKRQKYYPDAEDDAEATLVEPRFDEEAKEAARPVVPLAQVTQADLYAAVPPHLTARHGRSGPPRGLTITVAVVALLAAATVAALYRSARTTAPQPAPQTLSRADDAPAEPATVERAPEPVPEPPAATQAKENGTVSPAQPPRESEARVETPAREEPEKSWHKNEERRARDEEKSVERARKDEKKEVKREEKEAERVAEQQGEKREETRPRLVGIYVEGRKP